jgi:hypothetical protein
MSMLTKLLSRVVKLFIGEWFDQTRTSSISLPSIVDLK